MHTFNLPGSAHNSNDRQQPQQQLNERLHMLQQQEEMKPFLHPPAVTGFYCECGFALEPRNPAKILCATSNEPTATEPQIGICADELQ